MPARMISLTFKDHQILWPVILLVSVDMVYDFTLPKRPSKDLFRHSSVFMLAV